MSTESFLGIDWGTHSSKWAWYRSSAGRYDKQLPIYPSDLARNGDELTFSPLPDKNQKDLIRGIKGVLITDPLGTPFWSNEARGDTGTSLGESVAFSLCAMLNDALGRSDSSEDFEIGFSFPNWLVEEDRKVQVAAQNFREAVAVAVEAVAQGKADELPLPHKPYSISRWRELVSRIRPTVSEAKRLTSRQ